MSSLPVSAETVKAKEFWIGFLLAGLGAVLFSAKAIVVKLTYRYGVDALTIIGFRMMLSLPFFVAVGIVQARKARQGKLPRLTARESLQIVFLGFIGYYLSSYLDFLGLQYITAGLERLILFLSPTFVLLISALYLKRPIAGRQWFALCMAYLGVILVFVQDLSLSGDNVMLGSMFVLGSALTYSLYIISSGELIKHVGATRLVAYAMSVSAVISMIHFLSVHSWQGLIQPLAVYELSLLHAVVHTVAPTFMIMWSVARIGAPMTSQLGLLGPVSVLFLAGWILDEPVTLLQLVGTAFVLAGAVVLGRRKA
ncbi:DMT family transporter [Candidimonas sp. SYP-B2681]|uniref:DMT family transporter n=1 Tax=Candidimonas sp. SYP-B2681 TaxID=2497686 RepID=UPI000F86465D|nr:DMT family transporter [Candidimonas sp. SYP-B2681]RTZ47496.1 DMT family transporter [Candidimonas sp. SYP-B2681]